MTNRTGWVAAVAVALWGCAGPGAAIDRLEDRREAADALRGFLEDPEPEVRARALLAAARLQDPRSIPAVVSALADPVARVRLRAAFAAGQLGLSWQPLEEGQREVLAQAVVAALEGEADPSVRARLLRALGDVSGARALAALLAHGREPGAALALGVAVRRGATAPAGARALFTQLTAPSLPDADREAGAYGLSVLKGEPLARAPLEASLADRSGLVRSLAAKGLGGLLDDAGAPVLAAPLADSDWRVAAEAARALARISGRCAVPLCRADAVLAQGLVEWIARLAPAPAGSPAGRDPFAQVVLALAQEGLPAHGAPVLAALRGALSPRLSEGSLFENLDCRLAAAQVRLEQSLLPVRGCGGGQLAPGLRLSWGLRALASHPPPASAELVAEVAALLSGPDGRVVPAALEALAALGGAQARAAVRPLLGSTDPIVAAAAASAAVTLLDREALAEIGRLIAQGKGNLDVAAGLADAAAALKAWDGEVPAPGPVAKQAAQWLTPWLSAEHAVVRHAAAQAITRLTGVATRAVELPLAEPSPAAGVLPEGAVLVLTTEAGSIRLALEAQRAPRTSAWFADLARRGYFDGLTFHRVVPDFVVQGGDPRGDGEGGPGAALRCEINDAPYGTGALGVALSGKDTGGSQFFITHAPQPHLDGRYTVFGRVLEGQRVADGLLEGDLLLRAQIDAP